jgi:hypothetical protein
MWLDRAWRKGIGGSICPEYSWDPVTKYYGCNKAESPAVQVASSIVTNVDDYIRFGAVHLWPHGERRRCGRATDVGLS